MSAPDQPAGKVRAAGQMQPRQAGAKPPTAPSADLSRFWDAMAPWAEADPVAAPQPGTITLPPAPLAIDGRNLADLLTPVMHHLATRAAGLLGTDEAPGAGPARSPARRTQTEPPPPAKAAASPAAASHVLPAANFRAMDWEGLAGYCRKHLPDAGNPAARDRFARPGADKRTRDGAAKLAGELRRWQRVFTLDLSQGHAQGRMATQAKLRVIGGWLKVLEGVADER